MFHLLPKTRDAGLLQASCNVKSQSELFSKPYDPWTLKHSSYSHSGSAMGEYVCSRIIQACHSRKYRQTKIALKCQDEEELRILEAQAKSLNLVARSIQDA